MNKKQKYELLAPAGDFASLRAGVSGGCDAVYFGLQEFNMRDSAKNFSIDDLDKIRAVCNSGEYKKNKKVKMYLTLNIVIYNNELEKLEKLIKELKGKIDAIICWDFSVIELCKKYKIPFHISTQASISNIKSAEFYKKLGAERIILARELNLKQIKEISKIMDIECFIHGAMCVSISGRCFLSQFLHDKSANRGKCLQVCRREWIIKDDAGNELKLENNRIMSAKDLCCLEIIEEIKKIGVKSFKIEGRNRGPDYVYNVVKVYRKALDKKLSSKEIDSELKELKKVYHRGFSSGFYLKNPGKQDFSDSESGEQTETKSRIGRIEKYWPKISVANIKIFSENLKIGDEIYIIGKDIGLKKIKIKTMEIEYKKVKKASKGENVGIKLPTSVVCKKNDDVYLIKKKKL